RQPDRRRAHPGPTLAVIVGAMSTPAAGAASCPCNEAFADARQPRACAAWLQQRYALSGACRSRAFRFQLTAGWLASGLHRLPLPGTLRQGAEPVRSFWWGPTSSSRSGWYGSSPLASAGAAGVLPPVPACSRSPRRTAFSAATAACARRCARAGYPLHYREFPAVTTLRGVGPGASAEGSAFVAGALGRLALAWGG
ncbi:hypothetical protein P4200_00005, partial [Pseudomonas aeruginosa]|nr:hypothetical protein [Pseudomonas aeruginosa]